VLTNRKSVFISDSTEKGIHIIASEIFSLASLLTNDQVLMPIRSRVVSITTIMLVHTLY
jgi:hypothetical protein